MRMTGQEWRRRWQRSRPVSSALVDQSGLPRGGAGSHEADLLRELHERHADALWSYALRLTGDRDRAQDVVQETLLRAWRNPQILDPECGSQRSWLYTVARNIVIDRRARPADAGASERAERVLLSRQLGCTGRACAGDRARHGEVPHLLCAVCAAAGHRGTSCARGGTRRGPVSQGRWLVSLTRWTAANPRPCHRISLMQAEPRYSR